MIFAWTEVSEKGFRGRVRRSPFSRRGFVRRLVWLGLSIVLFVFPAFAWAQTPTPDLPAGPASGGLSPDKMLGNINGTIVDETGAAVAGAHVRLTSSNPSQNREVLTGDDGEFSFDNVSPGPFQLTVASASFAPQGYSGTLHPGEYCIVPAIELAVATAVTNVVVSVPQTEIAEEQIKVEEHQRVLGLIPNFYVTYDPHPAPLSAKQKFELAWKSTLDPVTFGFTGAVAGMEQAGGEFGGYGGGAEGYAKRYGASYADLTTSTFIGADLLPTLLKQDPRYFYKGQGSTRARALYAVANAVICKGDNGKWQPNYSAILGGLASGGISNLYYPPENRGVDLTFENTLVGIGENAVSNLFQEFLVTKLTPHLPHH
ncbi:MAG TPA: carboxypeptidase-like regulatory domain-containing protein [Candidatus Cybelea sp.]|nr:carboxypeptidase-like regulatory domain-containing protein [Candidatus Cybelea sp.]